MSQTTRRAPLPQIVPSATCLRCDVCCRFPEQDSFLRPYFTQEEIARAVARGLAPAHFPDRNGGQINVVPDPSGDGYLCPAFDPATSHCRIYEDRPLDCRIYPLAVMWGAPDTDAQARDTRRGARGEGASGEGRDHSLSTQHSALSASTKVVLGWDAKCPFLKSGDGQGAIGNRQESVPSPMAHDPLPGLRAYAEKIAEWLERDDIVERIATHPGLIGRFQDDVMILRALPKLSARMRAGCEARGARRETKPEGKVSGLEARGPQLAAALWPLTPAARARFEQACAVVNTPLAHYALAPHLIWKDLFRYAWTEIDRCLCLFADYADGLYMPLPPLPAPAGAGHEARGARQESGPEARGPQLAAALAACFAIMRARNRGSAVSRVENVPEEWRARLEALGYRVRPKDPDYLYRAADLLRLAGDRYKSQRAACNRFEREHGAELAPYDDRDRDACLALFREWSRQKQAAGLGESGRHMLADSEAAHREALAQHRELGLIGWVVKLNGQVRAYTFGCARSPSVYCVLLEVADRSVPGLAEWIFREHCREAAGRGCESVNTMDDAGLPTLAQSKRAWHPVQLVANYIVTED